MTRDQNKIVKKEQNKASKKRDEALRRRKNNEESSDDGEPNSSDSESDEMDQHEYRKFLSKMFPSKHAKDKVKAGEKLKKTLRNDQKKKNKKEESEEDDENDIDDSESDSDYVSKKSKSKSKKNNKKGQSSRLRRKVYEIEESEEEDDGDDITLESEDESEDFETEETEDEDDDVDESEEESIEEVKPKRRSKKSDNFNIVLTIGNGVNREEELEDEYADFFDEEDWETCSDDDAETENEDDPISSDSDSEEDEEEEEEEEELPKKKKGSNKKVLGKKDKVVDKKKSEKEKETENIKLVTTEKTTDVEVQNKLLEVLNGLKERGENTSLVNECIKVCNQKIEVDKKKTEKKLKKEKDRNDRIFKRILKDKNTMNDFEFFEKMDVVSQKKIIKELREINKLTRIEKPYRLTLLEADIPVIFKGAAMKRVASLRYMEPGSGEYYKIKTWVDTFMRIPFSKYQNLPISIEDGVEKCHDFMADAQKTLDSAVYGLNDAKMQIMQMLGQLITNPKAIGTAIAIHGPPGTG